MAAARAIVCRPKPNGSGPRVEGRKPTLSLGRHPSAILPDYEIAGRKAEPVGRYAPNAFGLYDICENVHEWCSDWYQAGYYAISPDRNPAGPERGDRRASRGGSWRHHVKASRCAARSSIPPEFRYADYGFRVACSL